MPSNKKSSSAITLDRSTFVCRRSLRARKRAPGARRGIQSMRHSRCKKESRGSKGPPRPFPATTLPTRRGICSARYAQESSAPPAFASRNFHRLLSLPIAFPSGMLGESGFNEEMGDANNGYGFGQGRCDRDSAVNCRCDDDARVGTNNGEPVNRAKDRPDLRKMSYGTACTQ